MESNGVPGKIHCSQSTRDALVSAGHGDWIVPREDKIQAKGLGELQTYFVNVPLSGGTTNKASSVTSDEEIRQRLTERLSRNEKD